MGLFSEKKDIAVFADQRTTKYVEFDLQKTTEDEIHIKNYGCVKHELEPFGFIEVSKDISDPLSKEIIPEIKRTLNLGFYDNVAIINHPCYNIHSWLSLPDKRGVDVSKILLSKLEELLPHPIEKWMVSFVHYDDSKRDNYLTSAILKDGFNNIKKAFTKNYLKVVSSRPGNFGLENLIQKHLEAEENENKNIAIVDFGEELTTVSVYKEGLLHTIRKMPVGEARFIKAFMAQLNISEQEAEDVLYEGTVFITGAMAEQNKVKNYNTIKAILGELIKELYNSFDSFLAKFREFKIDEIIFCGQGSTVPNIGKTIQEHLNIPVKPLSDIVSVKHNGKDLDANVINSFASVLASCYPNKWDYLGENVTSAREKIDVKKYLRNLFGKLKNKIRFQRINKPGFVIIQNADDEMFAHICKKYWFVNDDKFVKLKNGQGPNSSSVYMIKADEISRIYSVSNIDINPKLFLVKESEYNKKIKGNNGLIKIV